MSRLGTLDLRSNLGRSRPGRKLSHTRASTRPARLFARELVDWGNFPLERAVSTAGQLMASTIDAHEAREVSHSRSRVWGVPFGAETTQLLPPGRVDAGRFQCG